MPALPKGLYAIVDGSAARPPLELVGAFVRGGAAVVQLRLKQVGAGELVRVARQARNLCAGKAMLLINDRPDVARIAEARRSAPRAGRPALRSGARHPRTGRPDRRQHPLRRGDRGGAVRRLHRVRADLRDRLEAGFEAAGAARDRGAAPSRAAIRGSPWWPSAGSPPRPRAPWPRRARAAPRRSPPCATPRIPEGAARAMARAFGR